MNVNQYYLNRLIELDLLVEGNLRCLIIVVQMKENENQSNVHKPQRILSITNNHVFLLLDKNIQLPSLISAVVNRIRFGTRRIRPQSELE